MNLAFAEAQLLESVLVFLRHVDGTHGRWSTVDINARLRALISNVHAKLRAYDQCIWTVPARYTNVAQHPLKAKSRSDLVIAVEALVCHCFYTSASARDITAEELTHTVLDCGGVLALRKDVIRMEKMVRELEKVEDKKLDNVRGTLALERIESENEKQKKGDDDETTKG